MTSFILKIASVAVVLSDIKTWKAFNWNRTELSLADALDGLADDLEVMRDAFDEAIEYGRYTHR